MKRSLSAAVLVCLLALAAVLAGCGGGHNQRLAPPTAGCAGYVTQYGCQAHSPTFGLPPKGLTVTRPASLAGTADMYDSVTISQIPAGSFAVAGYTSGFFPTYPVLLKAFPHAHVISIAINTSHTAQCGDFEPGDMDPAADAAAWYFAEKAAGVARPCEYASLSNMAELRANLAAHGISRSSVFLWDADWTFVRHLDQGYDATQWTDHFGDRNLDASVVTLRFVGINPHPQPKRDRYALYPKTLRHFKRGITARESGTVRWWDRRHCLNPVRRRACEATRVRLVLLRDRDVFIATHQPPRFKRPAHRYARDHLAGRVSQLQRRLHQTR